MGRERDPPSEARGRRRHRRHPPSAPERRGRRKSAQLPSRLTDRARAIPALRIRRRREMSGRAYRLERSRDGRYGNSDAAPQYLSQRSVRRPSKRPGGISAGKLAQGTCTARELLERSPTPSCRECAHSQQRFGAEPRLRSSSEGALAAACFARSASAARTLACSRGSADAAR
jgi:hypothetical protein